MFLTRLVMFCLELVSNLGFQLLATISCYRCRRMSTSTTSAQSLSHNNNNHHHHQTNNQSSQYLRSKIFQNECSYRKDSTQQCSYTNGSVSNGHHSSYTKASKSSTNGHVSNGALNGTVDLNKKYSLVTNGQLPYSMSQTYERPKIPMYMYFSNILCHGTLILFGKMNDFLRQIGWLDSIEHVERNRPGYPKLYSSFTTFYIRNIIQRLVNMWSHPICSVPGAITHILEREFGPYNATWKFTGRVIKTINMGSYDYLGHSENKGPRIDSVQSTILKNGVATGSTTSELGTYECYAQLEKKVSQFLGVEDSVVIGMGFATNALSLPCLFGAGSLVISDECNHASLALGCKLSGAKVLRFNHNDMVHLESILRKSIVNGQPGTGKKWTKIIIIVEGIYSMEGTIVKLPELIRMKKQYKTYLYMDEAHSIGAMGHRGRGICDYYGCDPKDVDILMGTFTKSFAAAGGYIAGNKSVIDYIRAYSASFYYGAPMSPAVVQQISYILDEFMSMDKNNNSRCQLQARISQLRKNVNNFRHKLKKLGFHIDGNDDSPVVPLMVYSPTNLKCLISKLLSKNIASTGAAYPVTSLTGIRARFCLSAAHTDDMIEYTIKCLNEIGTEIGIKFDQNKA